jgi:hypothetical protein
MACTTQPPTSRSNQARRIPRAGRVGLGVHGAGGGRGGAGSTAHAQGNATRRCWEGMGGGRPLVQGLLMIGCRSSSGAQAGAGTASGGAAVE